MIIGKTSIESSDFDCFVFGIKTINTAIIPNFIKYIGSDAFCNSFINNIIIPTEIIVIR